MTIHPLLLIAIAIVVIALYARLYLRHRRNIRKVAFLFNAVDNADFSFSFPTQGVRSSDRTLNQALNRIRQFLQSARDEAIDREKYYEQILEAIDTGVIVTNDRGNVLQHNAAALRLLGRDTLTHIDQVKEILLSGSLSKRETSARLRDKRVRILVINDISSELGNSEIDSWVKLVRVLTHEIMNTVAPIASLSDQLLKTSEGVQHEGLEAIHKTAGELIGFVENYRKFTHVPKPEPRLFYVKPFLERMARLVPNGQEIRIEVVPDDLLLYADESLLSRVVTNILKNAVEATSHGGCVWMAAQSDNRDAVTISISNDGGLIDDEVAKQIFVPFFTTKRDGNGIGLSLSRQIMRVSGGMLTLRQDKQHGVVTFDIVFP